MAENLKEIARTLSHLAGPAFTLILLIVYATKLRGKRWAALTRVDGGRVNRRFDTLMDATGLVLLMAISAASLSYLFYPGYLDHMEPLMAATSWLSLHRLPVHPAWTEGQGLYGMLYGPALYQITSVALSISPTIFGSKVAGILACGLAFFFQLLTIFYIERTGRRRLRLFVLAGIIESNTYYIFTDRPDAYLLALASIGLYGLIAWRSGRAALVIGLAAGLAANMKSHAFLYLVPAAAALLAQQHGFLGKLRCVSIGVIAAAAAVSLPFVIPGANLSHFLDYMILATHHGLDSLLLLENVGLAIALIMLPWGALWVLRARLSQADIALLVSFVVAVILVSVIAGKAGAGPHHLYPFVPTAVYSLARILNTPGGVADSAASEGVLRLLVWPALGTFGLISLLTSEHMVKVSFADRNRAKELSAELVDIFMKNPTAEMGASGDAEFPDTFVFPVLTFKGGPLLLNPAAWMDLKQGVSETYAVGLLDRCRVPAWILPANGRPFSMLNNYTWKPLFSDQFIATFNSNYRLTFRGKYYNLWSCASAV